MKTTGKEMGMKLMKWKIEIRSSILQAISLLLDTNPTTSTCCMPGTSGMSVSIYSLDHNTTSLWRSAGELGKLRPVTDFA